MLAIGINASAASAQDGLSAAKRYQACTRLAASDAGAALSVASLWRDQGGGVAAQHCIALALTGLERYGEAAQMLETVLQHMRAGRGVDAMGLTITRGLVAQLHAQAGHGWLLAGRPVDAYQAFSAALAELPPYDPAALDYLIDRARASAASGNYAEAVQDLDKAQAMAPDRGDIYLFRATARRHLGEIDDGLADAGLAVSLLASAAAHLERGNLRLLAGDDAGARADWTLAAEAEPDGPTGDAARTNITRLDEALAAQP